jgi:hypothetical protein
MGIEIYCYAFIIVWLAVILTYGITRNSVENELKEAFIDIYGEADIFLSKFTEAIVSKFTEEFIKMLSEHKQAGMN